MEAAASPLPSDETTPPVTRMYFTGRPAGPTLRCALESVCMSCLDAELVSVFGCWLLVVRWSLGCWLSVVRLVVRCWLFGGLLVVGCSVGCWLLVVRWVVGCSLGCW